MDVTAPLISSKDKANAKSIETKINTSQLRKSRQIQIFRFFKTKLEIKA